MSFALLFVLVYEFLFLFKLCSWERIMGVGKALYSTKPYTLVYGICFVLRVF